MAALSQLSAKCQHNLDVTSVEFRSSARGYQKTVLVSADSVFTAVNNRGDGDTTKRKISNDEWNDVIQSIQTLSQVDITQLQSPTSDRSRDAAKHSTITIATTDGQKRTHTFDDQKPNEKLVPLMHALNKIDNRIHVD
jgi:hypothetical protein